MEKYKLYAENKYNSKNIDELFLSKGHNISLSSGSLNMSILMLKIWKEKLSNLTNKNNRRKYN